MTSELKTDSSIDSFIVEIVDMFSAFRDLVTKKEEKTQGYQTIFDLMISDLKVDSSIDFSIVNEIAERDF